MKELSDIINERDVKFKEETIKVFLMIDVSIECVEAMLNRVEPMFAAGDFSWNDVYLENDLIMMLGVVTFEPGMVVETLEGTVNITKENADYFQRVVRMKLPYELVANGDREAIIKFLEELHETNKGENEDLITIKDAPDETTADFDLSELTTDQQDALKLYTNNKQTNN